MTYIWRKTFFHRQQRMSSRLDHACLHRRDVLSVEDLEGLLKGLDLFLPAADTVLIALGLTNARWLQLVKVSQSGVEFLLGALEVGLLLSEGLRLILLLGALVLNGRGLSGLVNLGILHEGVVLLLGGGLTCVGVCGQAGEVGLNHLEHADDTAALGAHALVGLVEDLRGLWLLLDESSCLGCLGVELLEDGQGLGDGNLR